MLEKMIIDPILRVNGPMRVELEVENEIVKKAWVVGKTARGFEILLKNKDPRDAPIITQRICGLCFASHAYVSCSGLEKAFKIRMPEVARLVRNTVVGANWLAHNIFHFYQIVLLDYLDLSKLVEYSGGDSNLLKIKENMRNLLDSQDFYPFLTPYNDPSDPYIIRDPEIVIQMMNSYFKAFEAGKKTQKIVALLGGKSPGLVTFIPGGITFCPSLDTIIHCQYLLKEILDFIKEVYLADIVALATGPLLPLAQSKIGEAQGNYLSFGMFDLAPLSKEKFFLPGVIFNGQLDKIEKLYLREIEEEVISSWYQDDDGLKSPTKNETNFDLEKEGAYSFIKAPRYLGNPMEVGSLARLLIKKDQTLLDLINRYEIKLGVVARLAARALEAFKIGEALFSWLEELINSLKNGQSDVYFESQIKGSAVGIGLGEAFRGALGHWVSIREGRIDNYQCITPSAWNASPRDERGTPGPLEKALEGAPVPLKNPLNIFRVIRSFDPCLPCAVHIIK